jgi:DNA repair ATPase RecN
MNNPPSDKKQQEAGNMRQKQAMYRRYRNRLDEVLRKKNPTLEELKEVAPLKRACKKLEREIAQAWDNEN